MIDYTGALQNLGHRENYASALEMKYFFASDISLALERDSHSYSL